MIFEFGADKGVVLCRHSASLFCHSEGAFGDRRIHSFRFFRFGCYGPFAALLSDVQKNALRTGRFFCLKRMRSNYETPNVKVLVPAETVS